MKKLITILSVLFLFSCNDNITISKEDIQEIEEYPKIININGKAYYLFLDCDSHEYYREKKYRRSYYWHYIDCKKCKKDTL